MKRVISKFVTADISNPGSFLTEDYFDQIRDRMKWPTNRYRGKELSGVNPIKKTVISVPGLGTNDRGVNPGAGMGLGRDENESSDRRMSSGYNDGGQADDETGPGQTSIVPDPDTSIKMNNELFMDLDMMGQGHNESIRGHLKNIKNHGPVAPHTRYKVDDLK